MPVRARPVPTAFATSQSGFSLLEVTMALMLLGAMSLGMLQLQQFQQHVESGRLAGQRLAALRDGAERYARDHGEALVATVRSAPTCADIALSRQASATTPTPSTCALAAKAAKAEGAAEPAVQPLAANALQPTFQELRALGYVTLDDRLPFPHGDTIVDGRTGRTAEPRWAVSVQCHAQCDTAAGARAAILRVTLYNTQPFFAKDDALPFGYGAQLKATLQALGPDAMVSLPGESAQTAARLHGKGAAPVPNPLKGDGADTGVAGVLASSRLVHLAGGPAQGPACGVATGTSGPGASGAACLDGTSKPTARWDFNEQALDKVGELSVTRDASVGGRVSAGGLHIRQPDRDPARPHGPPVVQVHGGTHVAGGMTIGGQPLHADWSEPGLKLKGGILAVQEGGYGDFSGGGTDSRRGGILLPVRRPGSPCNAQGIQASMSGGNIALYQEADGIYVMVCKNGPGTSDGAWVKAAPALAEAGQAGQAGQAGLARRRAPRAAAAASAHH